MACFLVPAAEAVVTTAVSKIIQKKEAHSTPETIHISLEHMSVGEAEKIPFSRKLDWLNNLLWGGSALLAFEHIWHGEVVPWFPFLTAASAPSTAAEMIHEMSTAGVTMAVLVTAIWTGMLAVSALIEKRALKMTAPLPSTKLSK